MESIAKIEHLPKLIRKMGAGTYRIKINKNMGIEIFTYEERKEKKEIAELVERIEKEDC